MEAFLAVVVLDGLAIAWWLTLAQSSHKSKGCPHCHTDLLPTSL
jgi:hypothetical protein